MRQVEPRSLPGKPAVCGGLVGIQDIGSIDVCMKEISAQVNLPPGCRFIRTRKFSAPGPFIAKVLRQGYRISALIHLPDAVDPSPRVAVIDARCKRAFFKFLDMPDLAHITELRVQVGVAAPEVPAVEVGHEGTEVVVKRPPYTPAVTNLYGIFFFQFQGKVCAGKKVYVIP